ncbi:MAG: hypothetical protein SNJ70_01230 [Armatimonadota bacterium]
MTSHSELDPKKKAELDSLIRSAYINKQRSNYDLASLDIEKALEIDPNNLEAQEFAADLLVAKWHLKEARDIYKAIIEKDPSRVTAEEKYAKIVLMIAEGERQRELLKEKILHPQKRQEIKRNTSIAFLLSVAPGFGHVYLNNFKKGAMIFCAAMLFWLFFSLLRPAMPTAIQMSAQAKALYFTQNMSAATVMFLCLAVFTHIYAIVDIAVLSSIQGKKDSSS